MRAANAKGRRFDCPVNFHPSACTLQQRRCGPDSILPSAGDSLVGARNPNRSKIGNAYRQPFA